MEPTRGPAPRPGRPDGPGDRDRADGPTGPDLEGWVRLEPLVVSRLHDRLVIDAVLIDAVVLGGPDFFAGTPLCGVAGRPERGAPVTLSLAVRGDAAGGAGAGTDLTVDELADALRDADTVHVFRDEVGTAVILRRGPAWWYLEVD